VWAGIPGARVVTLDGAGHCGAAERPDEVAALVLGHLTSS